MNNVYLIKPNTISNQLDNMILAAFPDGDSIKVVTRCDGFDFRSKKLVFALELDEAGFCIPVFNVLSELYSKKNSSMEGSSAILFVHSSSELYTKSTAANIIFLANQLGCRFIGHPMVEATGDLNNFSTWQKTMDMPLEEICLEHCRRLGKRFIDDSPLPVKKPNLLVLHASSRKTSNTLMLWYKIKEHLSGINIRELHVENGTVLDCIGCSFKTCMHYSTQSSCFYGGVMVEEIFPAIDRADAVLWICPNYNDSISANLAAVINRMTALYRKTGFYNKTLFSVVVSGNSGSDSVAKQLIGSLNINKGFRLPPHFTIMETANDAGAILKMQDIDERARIFAHNLMREIKL